MIEADAREILEVSANATRDEIINAYKRLIGKVHPDRGGSNYFAKQLNEAKAVLLGE
jgi:DnaJ-class molecular chaperone